MRAHIKADEPVWSADNNSTRWWGWAYRIKGDDHLILCVYPSQELALRYVPKHQTTQRALIPIDINHDLLRPVDPEEGNQQ